MAPFESARATSCLLACVVVGCSGNQSTPPTHVDVTVARPTTSAATSPPPSASDLSQSRAAKTEVADRCATAFEDQLTLYVDIDVRERGVHPARKALFLEHCHKMPAAFQRCASPLYQIDHEAECEAVKEESGTPATRHWSAMFDVLKVEPGTLAQPLP